MVLVCSVVFYITDLKMDMWIAIMVVIVIIFIFWFWHAMRVGRCKREREFMTGFWCASPESCNTKGYREAYMYMGVPENDTNISRAYIVALKGGRGVINRPFDFDMKSAFSEGGSVCGKMNIDGRTADIAIDLDFLTSRMVWRDSFGNPLFTWEKNSRVTSELF